VYLEVGLFFSFSHLINLFPWFLPPVGLHGGPPYCKRWGGCQNLSNLTFFVCSTPPSGWPIFVNTPRPPPYGFIGPPGVWAGLGRKLGGSKFPGVRKPPAFFFQPYLFSPNLWASNLRVPPSHLFPDTPPRPWSGLSKLVIVGAKTTLAQSLLQTGKFKFFFFPTNSPLPYKVTNFAQKVKFFSHTFTDLFIKPPFQ